MKSSRKKKKQSQKTNGTFKKKNGLWIYEESSQNKRKKKESGCNQPVSRLAPVPTGSHLQYPLSLLWRLQKLIKLLQKSQFYVPDSGFLSESLKDNCGRGSPSFAGLQLEGEAKLGVLSGSSWFLCICGMASLIYRGFSKYVLDLDTNAFSSHKSP